MARGTDQSAVDAMSVSKPDVLRWLRIAAPITALLVLIQAVFAGRGLFIDAGELDLHGWIGNGTFLLAVIQTGLVFAAGFRGRPRNLLIGAHIALLVLLTAQLGLGYSGRESTTAAAMHIPNGVLIMGLATAITAMLHGTGAVRDRG